MRQNISNLFYALDLCLTTKLVRIPTARLASLENMSLTHIKVRSQNSFHLDVTREIASLEGHLFALPIIFINFGGEMIYVIEHRLRAQKLEDRMDKGG